MKNNSNWTRKRVIKTRPVPARREPIRDNEICTNPIFENRRPIIIIHYNDEEIYTYFKIRFQIFRNKAKIDVYYQQKNVSFFKSNP